MAIITKIRDKAGLAIGVVAVAMAAFIVGGDLLSQNSFFLGNNERFVGSVGGKEIAYQDYGKEVERMEAVYQAVGRPLDDATRAEIRRLAWEAIIDKYAYGPELAKLGIKLTPDELDELVRGNNMHPNMKALFNQFIGEANPEATPDPAKVSSVLAQLDQLPYQAQVYYYYMENLLKTDRPKSKYTKLIEETNFVTNAEAKREYQAQNSKAAAEILSIPFSSVPDSAINITEAALKEHYKKNTKKFKVNANVELEYISFAVQPSLEDEKAIEKEARQLTADFMESDDDSAFVEANSVAENKYLTLTPSNVPGQLDFGSLEVGKVYGPFRVGNSYKSYKILSTAQDSSGFVRASHILFGTQLFEGNKQKEDSVKNKANEILKKIKGGANFAEMAAEYGSDGTKNRGGDLGWFGKGRMVSEFEQACFKATKAGLLPELVKTQFGYHIIEVTAAKTTTTFNAAVLETKIEALDKSRDKAYRAAGRFSIYRSYDELSQAVKADSGGLILMQALRVPPTATYINNLSGARVRDVVRWAYEEAKPGEVSKTIYDFDNSFVVVAMRKKVEEDEINLDAVRDEVKSDLMRKLKGEYVLQKLGDIKGQTLEQLKNKYGEGASLMTVGDISLNSFNVPEIGFAPRLLGAIFRTGVEQITPVAIEDAGVYIAQVKEISKPAETADYGLYKTQLKQRRASQTSYKVQQAIIKFYEVKDKTYNY